MSPEFSSTRSFLSEIMVTFLCSQDPDELEWLKDCNCPLWSPSYEPNYGSYVEEVKNTEPPDYIKELASSDGMLIPFFSSQELNPFFSWIDFFLTPPSVKEKLTIFLQYDSSVNLKC